MRRLVVGAIAGVAAATGAAASDGTGVRSLARDSELEMMVLREVDSNKAQPGDEVRLMLTRPLTLSDGTMLADKGVRAVGTVLEAKKAGIALRRGAIRVALKSLAVGDTALPLTGEIQRKGKGGKADDALKLALVPFYVLFSPGNAAKLKAGETVYARTETELCLTTDASAQVADCPGAAAPTPQ